MSPELRNLSRRERQIMDVIYMRSRATVAEVLDNLPDAPGYSSVRTILGVLVEKGYLWHERESHHYVYHPTTSPSEARTEMMGHVVETFFQGSVRDAVSALIDLSNEDLAPQDYDEIIDLVKESRKAGR